MEGSMSGKPDTSNWSCVFVNADVATMEQASAPYGLIADGAVAVSGPDIAWVGSGNEVPEHNAAQVDCGGAVLTPGLIDCHTHLVYGGNRAAEFEERLNGASYEDIARRGGGIASTVEATRGESAGELVASGA